jgi:hypothetical protein
VEKPGKVGFSRDEYFWRGADFKRFKKLRAEALPKLADRPNQLNSVAARTG